MTSGDRHLTPDGPPGDGRPGTVGQSMRLCISHAALRPRPGSDCGIDTEILFGETLQVFDELEGWAHAKADRDGYSGWLPTNALEPVRQPATHRVAALRSYLYAGPSIKVPDPVLIPQGALLTVVRFDKDFAVLDRGGYVYAAHLVPVAEKAPDFVAVAEGYLGTAYLWGGRTSIGLDCSGLVQNALAAAGVSVPRDSGPQEKYFQNDIPIPSDLSGLKRGDLIFWKGHVGIMRDATTLLHANGHHMAVASEPLREAVDRILAKSYGPVTSIKRIL